MSDKTLPFCWKCVSKVTEQVDDKSLKLVGCLESTSIFNYDDAKKMCPLILAKGNKVLIIINQGVVTIDYKPDNVEVEIRDYDVEGDWDEENIGCKIDYEDCRYQEMIFPIEEIDLGSEQVIVKPNSIGWQPHEDNFPIAGLMTFEVYEDLEMGKGCHPEVKNWIEIFEGMIEEPTLIPSDKKEQKTITILLHNISYYLDDDSTVEVGDYVYEHIIHMIKRGYIEGELVKGDREDADKISNGYWKIIK